MPLIETLTLTLGPSLAKILLKVWFRDADIARESASQLVDILRTKTADVLAQQRGKRQFEAIGERFAESLAPFMEGTPLGEGSREAIAIAVATTLDRAKIDTALLIKRDLNPTELAASLRQTAPHAARDFTQDEEALYHRVLDECSAYIIDTASRLPGFTERTLAEILRREEHLTAIAHQTLTEVQQIRRGLANPTEVFTRFEEEYRRTVVRRLDHVELFGVDVSGANRRQRLSDAYVPLWISTATSSGSESVSPLQALLATSPRLILGGQAGSGKTTLLKQIAVQASRRGFAGPLQDWNEKIPFFIPLRQYAGAGLPAPEEFVRLTAPAIAGSMPQHWAHDQLRSGRAILLVDSVDEVPHIQRADVAVWLKELSESYHDCAIVVTSRPTAIEPSWMVSDGFTRAEVQPMDVPDIMTFIERWHSAIIDDVPDLESGDIRVLAGNLKSVILTNRPLANLATTPLLCAVLCALHRERRQQLPSDRVELYEACCQMLLERRASEQNLAIEQYYPQLSYRQKRVLLDDVAYWMMMNSWTIIPIERLDERLSKKLSNMETAGRLATADVRRMFLDRSGMLQEPVVGSVDFTHRTFQEFMAARSAFESGDTGMLADRATDDQWREVIILAAGIGGLRFREELITALIKRGDSDSRRRHQIHFLAVACLETSVELSSSVRATVQDRLSRAVPPKSMTDAKAVAAAGELAIPHLRRTRRQLSTEAAACVRALALIGGDGAFEALKSYSGETRQTVVAELLRAQELFTERDYGAEILTSLKPRVLRLDRTRSLDSLRFLPTVTSLDVGLLSSQIDLRPIGALSQLVSLSIRGEMTGELAFVHGLEHLTSLSVETGSHIRDLAPIARLSNLQRLSIWQAEHVVDLAPVSELTNLSTLRISGAQGIQSLWPVRGLTKLVVLQLSQISGGVKSINDIANLKNLFELHLMGLAGVSDLGALANLGALSALWLGGCGELTSLEPLSSLSRLRRLYLTGANALTDMTALSRNQQLQSLSLRNCPGVSDLSPISGLRLLSSVRMDNCSGVSDLSPLVGMKGLQRIEIIDPPPGLLIPAAIRKKVLTHRWRGRGAFRQV